MNKAFIIFIALLCIVFLNGIAFSLPSEMKNLSSAQIKEALRADITSSRHNQAALHRKRLNRVGLSHSESRKRGSPERFIFDRDERFAIENGIYKETNTLQEWLAEYNGVLITNHVSFNYLDEWAPDFSSPDRALRSFWHARSVCDSESILLNSDISFTHYWRNAPWLVGSPKMYCTDGATEITILLKGSCVLNGKEYTMLFFRRTYPSDPESNLFSLQRQFFVSLNGRYYLTYDPLTSRFGDIYKCLGMGDMATGGRYKSLASELEKTQAPKSFYLLDNHK